MVNRIKKSNGFHSTIAMQSFRKGFLRDIQPIDFWALSGGGFAPILLAGFFSDVADMETPILEDTAMNNPFCFGSSPLRFGFGELKIGWSPDVLKRKVYSFVNIMKINYHLLCQFPNCRVASYFLETGPPGFRFVIGQTDWIRLEHRKCGTKKPFFCFACNIKSTTTRQFWIWGLRSIYVYLAIWPIFSIWHDLVFFLEFQNNTHFLPVG